MRRTLFIILLALIILPAARPAAAADTPKVVGDGSPASCTEDALRAELEGGGTITFDCGGDVTIPITEELFFQDYDTIIDGGGQVTLEGTPGVHVIYFRTWGFDAARTLELRNMTITGASRSGAGEAANGAAIFAHSQAANYAIDIPTLIIDNVTFTDNVSNQTSGAGNSYDFGGGAIFIQAGDLYVYNSTFTGNRANGGAGGAIHGLASNILIENSTFENNVATRTGPGSNTSGYGGVLYVDGTLPESNNSRVEVRGSTFDSNSAANQGGFAYVNLYPSRNSRMIIDESTFTNNTVSEGVLGWGGALAGGGTGGSVPFIITNSLFANNTADGAVSGGDGGAIALPQIAHATIANSTFVGNQALVACNDDCFSGRGGAMYFSGTYEILNSTIVDNFAEWQAGAVLGSSGTIHNTIIANNSAGNKGGGITPDQCSDRVNGGNNIQWPDGGNRCVTGIDFRDPLLGPLTGEGVLVPAENSPAVNSGNIDTCVAAPVNRRDQRGVSRPQGAGCEIGAVELAEDNLLANASFEEPLSPTADWSVVSTGGSLDLRRQLGQATDGDYVMLFDGSNGIEGVGQLVPITGSEGDLVSLTFDIAGVNVRQGAFYGARFTFYSGDAAVGQMLSVAGKVRSSTFSDSAFVLLVNAPADFDSVMIEIGTRGMDRGLWGIDNARLSR